MNFSTKENYNASQHDAKLNPWTAHPTFYLVQLLQVLVKLVHSSSPCRWSWRQEQCWPRSLTERAASGEAGWWAQVKNQICHRTVRSFYYFFGPSWKWKLPSHVGLFGTTWTIYIVHGILQSRILEWVVFPFSRGSSQPRDRTQVSHTAGRFFTSWATGKAYLEWVAIPSPGDLPNPGTEPGFPALQADSLPTDLSGKPYWRPKGFPGGLDGKESTCNAGDLGLSRELERSPRGGHGKPLQCSCLENPMDRGVWQAAVHGVAESDTTEQLSTSTED